MAARISSTGLIVLRKLFGAYSFRYTAIDNPMGSATAMAMNDVSSVPVTSGRIPKCLSANKGVHCVSNKNSLRGTRAKNTEDSEIRTQRMPMVVRMLTAAQRNSQFMPHLLFIEPQVMK